MKIGSMCRMATWSLSGKLEVFMSMFKVFDLCHSYGECLLTPSDYRHPERMTSVCRTLWYSCLQGMEVLKEALNRNDEKNYTEWFFRTEEGMSNISPFVSMVKVIPFTLQYQSFL